MRSWLFAIVAVVCTVNHSSWAQIIDNGDYEYAPGGSYTVQVGNSYTPRIGIIGDTDGGALWCTPAGSGYTVDELSKKFIQVGKSGGYWRDPSGARTDFLIWRVPVGVTVTDNGDGTATISGIDPYFVSPGVNRLEDENGTILGSNQTSYLVSGTGTKTYVLYTRDGFGPNPTYSQSIPVTFSGPTSYTITASAGANGSISPSGSISVTAGNNQTFTITPNAGYEVNQVTVDGTNVGNVTSYTFNSVAGNHTINVTFKLITYTVTFKLNVLNAAVTLNGVTNTVGSYTFTGIEPGIYGYTIACEGYISVTGTVTITNKNETITVDLWTTGIEEIENKKIKIYSEGSSLIVESDVAMMSVEVYDLSGQVVRLMWVNNTQTRIDNLPTGILVVRVVLQGGVKIEKALIK